MRDGGAALFAAEFAGVTIVKIRSVRFEQLGPVDRRLSLPISTYGRIMCPYCRVNGKTHVGPFVVNQYLYDHLRRDHYRCTECDWVGVSPGQHVTRSSLHDGPVPTVRAGLTSVRIRDLMPGQRSARRYGGTLA